MSTEKEINQLADLLRTDPSERYGRSYARVDAVAILRAGYRKPRTIITADELDALPDGSAVLDADQDISTKHADKWHGYETAPLDSRKFAKVCGPFTIIWEPTT